MWSGPPADLAGRTSDCRGWHPLSRDADDDGQSLRKVRGARYLPPHLRQDPCQDNYYCTGPRCSTLRRLRNNRYPSTRRGPLADGGSRLACRLKSDRDISDPSNPRRPAGRIWGRQGGFTRPVPRKDAVFPLLQTTWLDFPQRLGYTFMPDASLPDRDANGPDAGAFGSGKDAFPPVAAPKPQQTRSPCCRTQIPVAHTSRICSSKDRRETRDQAVRSLS